MPSTFNKNCTLKAKLIFFFSTFDYLLNYGFIRRILRNPVYASKISNSDSMRLFCSWMIIKMKLIREKYEKVATQQASSFELYFNS